ncbi:hypothetical protein Vretifemale_15301 [Volvox reticuliferus]|uniref:Uncharacterized protein n=1 Tax=Volvox reticuliferus TaxID=1737510 RepID=A0A8J4CTD6_9CHLO|nr:hypothetical protein Vretifemale_15301 [Volvox reticuliferus]
MPLQWWNLRLVRRCAWAQLGDAYAAQLFITKLVERFSAAAAAVHPSYLTWRPPPPPGAPMDVGLMGAGFVFLLGLPFSRRHLKSCVRGPHHLRCDDTHVRGDWKAAWLERAMPSLLVVWRVA